MINFDGFEIQNMDFSYSGEADVEKLKATPPTQEEIENGACTAVPHWHVSINLIHPETGEQNVLFFTGSEEGWNIDRLKHKLVDEKLETVKLLNKLREMGVDIQPVGPDGPPGIPPQQGSQDDSHTGFYL